MKTIYCLSGGMDSVALLHHGISLGHSPVLCVSVDYGQRHRKELDYAERVACAVGSRHVVVNLKEFGALLQSSCLTAKDAVVPEGHYADSAMRATIVPNRNMLLLSIAGAFAADVQATQIAYGAHCGDAAVYPDCRAEFIDAMRNALHLCTEPAIALWTPFVDITKSDIARIGADLHADLCATTWSCYKGEALHCGKCGTCVERREAFELAGIPDTTQYEGDGQ
jgi:7-cyano-7-deazaguanine synthase